MQKNMTFYSTCALSCGFLLVCLVCLPTLVRADIYRFVTIDGVETFTDAPREKDAQIVVRGAPKPPRTGTAKHLSKEGNRKPTPSLQEIIEKTIQAHQTATQEDDRGVPLVLLPVNGQITSGVGMRTDPFDGSWRYHNGIDIAVPEGTPVKAVAAGTVLYAGLRSGYGWTVLVEHDNGMITLYAHNSRVIAEVGQGIKKHEIVALAGSTGRSTGPHVHFEAWQAGNNITPAFMPGSSITIASLPNHHRNKARFRKEVLADGSLLITNMPNAIP